METLKFLMTSTFYPPYHIGGDAVHVKYLADELVKKGHEVHILHSIDAYMIKRKNTPALIDAGGVYIHPIKSHFNYSSYVAYLTGNSLKTNGFFNESVKQIKPDVVHHHNISLLGYNILKKCGQYVNLYTAHDYWLICQQNSLLSGSQICQNESCFSCVLKNKKAPQLWRHSASFKTAIREIDTLIAPSNYLSIKFQQHFGMKILTLPNFVPKITDTFESSGYSNFFLYAGVLEYHKGIMDLLDAYRSISQKIDSKLILVGSGTLQQVIIKYINKNNLTNKILLLGRVDNTLLYRLLNNAQALIMPSKWPENCPLIALEALSLGTPVISSNQGGLPEIVGKIDGDLIYDTLPALAQKLLNFKKSQYATTVDKLYHKYYAPNVFLTQYYAIINHLRGLQISD